MNRANERDTRTLQQLAQEALDVQNASNLSGVLLSWHKSYCRLRELLGHSDSTARDHAITAAWLCKVKDLLWRAEVRVERHRFLDIFDSVEMLVKGDARDVGTDNPQQSL